MANRVYLLEMVNDRAMFLTKLRQRRKLPRPTLPEASIRKARSILARQTEDQSNIGIKLEANVYTR